MLLPKGVRFGHFREVWYPNGELHVASRGGMTAAYVQDVDQDGGPLVYVAIAYCHENDNYNKRLGRIKAVGQLLRLTASGGRLEEETIAGGPRFFTEPGTIEDVIPQLFIRLSEETGYVQVAREKKRERHLNPHARSVM